MSPPHLRQVNLNFQSRHFSLFWKNSRRDAQGIGPIRDPLSNTYPTANVDRANIINRQFQSTFTSVSPLRLSQLRESTVLGGLADGTIIENSIPETLRPKVPEMPPIIILLLGILIIENASWPWPNKSRRSWHHQSYCAQILKGSSGSHAANYFSKVTRLWANPIWLEKRQLLRLCSNMWPCKLPPNLTDMHYLQINGT